MRASHSRTVDALCLGTALMAGGGGGCREGSQVVLRVCVDCFWIGARPVSTRCDAKAAIFGYYRGDRPRWR